MFGDSGNNRDWQVYLGHAVIFGAGFLAGIVFKKYLQTSKVLSGEAVEAFSRATRIASIRAKSLGRNHKMVFVIRQDLGMGKGKIAAQCSHAAIMCYQKAKVMDPENLEIWEATGVTKVCLKAEGDENDLKLLQKKAKELQLVTAVVCDAGHTQVLKKSVAAGSYTVLGIGPAPKDLIDKVTGHLKLF